MKMDELISREVVRRIIDSPRNQRQMLEMLESVPAVQPKTGRWIWWTDDRKDYAKCSECCFGEEGEMFWSDVTRYCPNCGAKMKNE